MPDLYKTSNEVRQTPWGLMFTANIFALIVGTIAAVLDGRRAARDEMQDITAQIRATSGSYCEGFNLPGLGTGVHGLFTGVFVFITTLVLALAVVAYFSKGFHMGSRVTTVLTLVLFVIGSTSVAFVCSGIAVSSTLVDFTDPCGRLISP